MIAYKHLNPFLKRLNDLLLELEHNRVWLHRRTNIKLSTINSWFSNNRYPRVDHAHRIAKELNVTVEYLMTGEEDRKITNPEVKIILDALEPLSHRELIRIQGIVLSNIPNIRDVEIRDFLAQLDD